jgi:RNA polymerase sigma factor (sigma-70 family)
MHEDSNEFMDQYKHIINKIVNKYRYAVDSKELRHECILSLYKNYISFKKGNVNAFLYTAVRNDILDFIRINKRQTSSFVVSEEIVNSRANNIDIESNIILKEKISCARKVLSKNQFLILKLLYAGYNQKQIASKLKVTQQSINVKIKRIRIKLRPIFLY